MASYTIELRRICDIYGREEVENWFKNYDITNFLTEEQIAQITKFNVWSKDRLASKIVDHYFMREIGFETPALFKHYAKVNMQEIMERKLPEIYSNFLEYDPLSNVDFTETYTREISGTNESTGTNQSSINNNEISKTSNNGSSSSNASNSSNSLGINNNTPQQRITKQNLDSGIYASSTEQNNNQSNSNEETNVTNQTLQNNSSNSSGNSTSKVNDKNNTIETFTRHEEGDNGVIITNQRLVKEFREIIVAIDESIILELNNLFMGLY